jgi:hypothetical protein
VIEGQGFRFDPDELYAFAAAGTRLVGTVDQARGELGAAGELPAGVFGEVGASSGFVAAFGERVAGLDGVLDAIGRGVDGLSAAVRQFGGGTLRLDDDAATDLRRAGEPV